MISVKDQELLLANIARRLKKRITVYAIGGTAMMFLGVKDATLDIDLVFGNKEERAIFKEAAEDIGYRKIDSVQVYGTKRNQPEMLKLKDERFDLFLDEVIHFIFSKEMKRRTEITLDFEDKLIVKVANHNDIILMKCATDRQKDKDDVRRIMELKGVDWDLIIEEARNQFKLGKESAFFELGCFLEHLKYKMKLDIPKEKLNLLFKLVKKQIDKK
tara:strand:+ start:16601 stop:17248 length:648 start_codon:yes stop_codon:yes gene_type:complete